MAEHAEHFSASDPRIIAFTAARGVGQGESASSFMWVSLYDMLLEWIDPEKVAILHKEEPPLPTTMRTPRAMANAYADDLSTLTSGKTAFYCQQRQADWLSAFCAFSGLELHLNKIIVLELGERCPRRPDHITVHDHEWKEIVCPILRCDYQGGGRHRLTMGQVSWNGHRSGSYGPTSTPNASPENHGLPLPSL
jgi:hypothetical protein